jgi:hypothetical protein
MGGQRVHQCGNQVNLATIAGTSLRPKPGLACDLAAAATGGGSVAPGGGRGRSGASP